MKTNFTKEEYETLVEMLYIASWVISAFDVGPQPDKQKYDDLEQKVLSHAKDFGMGKDIELDKNLKKYFHSREFEEGHTMELIDEFQDETFWDELMNRLAERDLVESYTEKEIKKMDVWDRITKTDEFADKYGEEFEENGIINLRLSKK